MEENVKSAAEAYDPKGGMLLGKRVFVGLSGGVDSAVSAALLQRDGASVTGVFVKGWYPPGMPCTWAEDRRDAMRVAAHLGIGFHTLDASEEYKRGVIDYMLAEYAAGRTPNPDVMCNREVKFGALYRFAMEHGADMLATGHYARAERAPEGNIALMRGIDQTKDQSYFLWAVPQEALDRVLFPLGGLHKEKVRALARAWSLPVARKRDSQGICFLGSISVDEFLRHELGTTPGIAVDDSGKEIGSHDGALLYTIGERVSLHSAPPGPWYVASKAIASNELVVTKKRSSADTRHTSALDLSSANWFQPVTAGNVLAQYRYHGPLVHGSLSADRTRFTSSELMEDPAAGQSLVLYEGSRVIGGGIIR